jgi:hypothetical protein
MGDDDGEQLVESKDSLGVSLQEQQEHDDWYINIAYI